MKSLLNKVLQGAWVLAMGLIGLAIIGLGYLLSWFALQFGIAALFGVIAFMVVIGFIQESAEAIMLAPFRGLRRLFMEAKPQPEPTPEAQAAMRKLSLGATACFCIGMVIAAIHFLAGGLG